VLSVSFHFVSLAALLCYLGASVDYLRLVWSASDQAGKLGRKLLVLGLAFHFLTLLVDRLGWLNSDSSAYLAVAGETFPDLLSAVSWLLIVSYVLLEKRLRLSFLGALLVPLAAVYMAVAGILFHYPRYYSPQFDLGEMASPALAAHGTFLVIGNASLVFSFAASLLILIQEGLLKKRIFSEAQRRMPALAILDRLNTVFLSIGFLCMLLGIGVGFAFAAVKGVRFVSYDTRVLASLATLLTYLLAVIARFSWRWRGRRIAILSVSGFAVLVISYWVSHYEGSSFHVY